MSIPKKNEKDRTGIEPELPATANPGNNFGTGPGLTPATNFGTNESVSPGPAKGQTEIEKNIERMKKEQKP